MGIHSKPSRLPAVLRAAAFSGALGVVGLSTQVASAPNAQATPAPVPAVNWDPIVHCESGGNPRVINSSGHAGLLQFSTATWLRYGGGKYAPTADQATPAEQISVAEAAYAANGLNDWLASKDCWNGLVDTSGTSHLAIPATPKKVAPKAVPKAAPPAATGRHDSGETRTATQTPRHAAPETAAAIEPILGADYTVKPGDTLWMIAKRHGGETWHDVYAKNTQVVGANPDLIRPGQHLTV